MYQDVSNIPWSTIPRNMSPALCLSMCVTSLQRVSLKQQNEWVSEGCTSKFNSPGECQMTLDLLVTSHKGLMQTSKENQLQKKSVLPFEGNGSLQERSLPLSRNSIFLRSKTLQKHYSWIVLDTFAFSSDQSYFLITLTMWKLSAPNTISKKILPRLFNGR